MWASSIKIEHRVPFLLDFKKKVLISDFVYSLGFSSTSSSTMGTNTDSMLLGLTNMEWVPSFVPKMTVRRSTLFTLKIIPFFMFLNLSPDFIIGFPFLRLARVLNS